MYKSAKKKVKSASYPSERYKPFKPITDVIEGWAKKDPVGSQICDVFMYVRDMFENDPERR